MDVCINNYYMRDPERTKKEERTERGKGEGTEKAQTGLKSPLGNCRAVP